MFLLSLSLIWNCWFYFQGAKMHLMTVVSCSSAKGLERPSHHSHFDMSYQIDLWKKSFKINLCGSQNALAAEVARLLLVKGDKSPLRIK